MYRGSDIFEVKTSVVVVITQDRHYGDCLKVISKFHFCLARKECSIKKGMPTGNWRCLLSQLSDLWRSLGITGLHVAALRQVQSSPTFNLYKKNSQLIPLSDIKGYVMASTALLCFWRVAQLQSCCMRLAWRAKDNQTPNRPPFVILILQVWLGWDTNIEADCTLEPHSRRFLCTHDYKRGLVVKSILKLVSMHGSVKWLITWLMKDHDMQSVCFSSQVLSLLTV